MSHQLPIAPEITDQQKQEILQNRQRYHHYALVADTYAVKDLVEGWKYLYNDNTQQILTVSRANTVYLPEHFYDFDQIDSYQHTFLAHRGEVFYGGVSFTAQEDDNAQTNIVLSWVLYPDGMYFGDGGYGMEDNCEVQVECILSPNLDIVKRVYVRKGDINISEYAKIIENPNVVVLTQCGSHREESVHKNIYTYGQKFSEVIIHKDAFRRLHTLVTLALSSSIREIQGDDLLDECPNLQTIYVPTGMKERFCQMGLRKWEDKIVEKDEDPDDREFIEDVRNLPSEE